MDKTPRFHFRGHGFSPGQGTKIPQAAVAKKKKKKDSLLGPTLTYRKGNSRNLVQLARLTHYRITTQNKKNIMGIALEKRAKYYWPK